MSLMILLLLASAERGRSELRAASASALYPNDEYDITCIVNITRRYFSEANSVVYFPPRTETNLLNVLHAMEMISFNVRTCKDVANPSLAYLLVITDTSDLPRQMEELAAEANWNPYARFLVVVNHLRKDRLSHVFDAFLRHRVYDVVIMSGALAADLYTYNPFENFACGKYYTRFIKFGKCSEVTADIFPVKATTGFKNCFFNVSVPHWPPYAVDPTKANDMIGSEQYIFHLMSEIEQFKYRFQFGYDPEEFSTVSNNLSISGPMLLLAQNQTDMMLGGLVLVPSRAHVFSYISGHLDYLDEVRIMVRKAEITPAWKDIYLEFSFPVWALLLLVLVLYSALLAILLKTKDCVRLILVLLDGLLSHGSKFECRQSVKCVVIVWVIFAYLMNSYYTTTLMSLTTKPSQGYQISDEGTLAGRRMDPCISFVMGKYLKSEASHEEVFKCKEGCEKLIDSIKTVSESDRMFTIVLYSVYSINKWKLYDLGGRSPVYSFPRPYAKVIYAIFFNKGTPMKGRLRLLALRIRQTGLSEKSLRDHYFRQMIKYHFHPEEFLVRFAVPWYLYVIGVCVSSVTFVVELSSSYNTSRAQSPDAA